MATRTIKTRLQLDGEQEYKQQLKDISSGMSVLKSEMKKVSAEFSENANSVEALNAKNDVLNRQILSQKEKIETLRNALKESAAAYGEADNRTESWQIKLNNAEAELYKMEHELENNNSALQNASVETEKTEGAFANFAAESKGLGDVIGDIAGKLGVNLPEGATKALNGMGSLNGGFAMAAAGAAALVSAIVKAEKELWNLTQEASDTADELLTLSLQTGVSSETLQEWAYAAELIDVDLGTLQTSLTKLTMNMDKARDGNESMSDAFSSLGVSIYDSNGALRSAESVFYDVIDALGEIQNTADRDAIAMEIFGRSAQDLNPLIIQGTETLRAYTDEAHNNAYVLTNEQLTALGAVNDAQVRLEKTQEAVSNQIASEYAPYMEAALTMTRDGISGIGEALEQTDMIECLGIIVSSIVSIIEPLGEIVKVLIPALAVALEPVALVLALIADTVNLIVGLFTDWYTGAGRMKTALGFGETQSNLQRYIYGASSSSSSGNYYNPETGMYEGNYFHNASGNDNFTGGLTWVGENGPELVNLPGGSSIYNNQASRSLGGDVFNITIDAASVQEFNDIIEIAQNARRLGRMGGAMA